MEKNEFSHFLTPKLKDSECAGPAGPSLPAESLYSL